MFKNLDSTLGSHYTYTATGVTRTRTVDALTHTSEKRVLSTDKESEQLRVSRRELSVASLLVLCLPALAVKLDEMWTQLAHGRLGEVDGAHTAIHVELAERRWTHSLRILSDHERRVKQCIVSLRPPTRRAEALTDPADAVPHRLNPCL